MRRYLRQTGVSLIEVIVGVGIITVMLVAIGFSVMTYIDARAALLNNTKAVYLAEEGYEILRALRDDSWNTIDTLTTDTYYYFDVSTTTIAVTNTPNVIDTNFRRSFKVYPLYRDANDDIADSGTADPDGRRVEVFVSGPNGTSSIQAILTNVFAI